MRLVGVVAIIPCVLASAAAAQPPSVASTPPPRNVPLIQRSWQQLSNQTVSVPGSSVLQLKPEQWRHAETENFVLHFRRVTDANAVAREIEFDLWFVAKELGATKEQYARKSHVYIFKDEREWQKFLADIAAPPWAQSLARGDELFLNVRGAGGFDEETVAHEATHAVVSRIYAGRRWPLWLSEGFAEYMGRASVAARHHQHVRRTQRALQRAELSFAELTATAIYPKDPQGVAQLYETSEKFVRYLLNNYPKQLFPQFVDRVLAGEPAAAALAAVYGQEFNDMAAFERKFARFIR
jgi:hypothetical protein